MASKKSHFGFGKSFDQSGQSRKSKIKMRILEPRLTPSGLFDSGDLPVTVLPDLIADHHVGDGVENLHYLSHDSSVATASDTTHSFEVPTHTESIEPVVSQTIPPAIAAALHTPNLTATQFDSGVFTVGDTGKVSIDFLYDGGGYQGQLAIFSLKGMDAFVPGSAEFIHEAASRAISNSDLGHIIIDDLSQGAHFTSGDNSGSYVGEQSFQMQVGDRFGLMLIPNGKVETFIDHPDLSGSLRPLFSLTTANPHEAFHIGQIADVTGDGKVFVFEDLRVDIGSDHDYNDLVFHVKGAEGKAITFDQLIAEGSLNPNHDWRNGELGHELLKYVYDSPTDNPVVLPAISPEVLQSTDLALNDLANVISTHSDLRSALNSSAADAPINSLLNALSENPTLAQILTSHDYDSQLSDVGTTTLHQLLQSPEVGELFLNQPIPLEIALTNPKIWDAYLVNAQEAIALIPPDANQPLVGFLDFSAGLHDQYGLDAFSIINPVSQPEIYHVNNGNWAEQLIAFVNDVKASGNNYGIANFGGDLTQIDGEGRITTRYELTVQEQLAIKYARENNVLLVVAAGNTGDRMSALGAASQLFGNIITVGAINNWEDRASYSSQGEGLTLVAPGGEFQNNPQAFVGTSRASAEVSGAASLIWAANPLLSSEQVKQILIATARDLKEDGWDAKTGNGLLDVKSAVLAARAIAPAKPSIAKEFAPTSFSGEGRVSPIERPASPSTEQAIAALADRQNLLFDQWQTLIDLGIPALTLAELQTKTNSAFDKYEQVTKDAAIANAHAQLAADEFVLAANHAQIYREQLQKLEARKQELEQQLAQLSLDKTSLVTYTQQLLESLQADIGKTTKALEQAEAKLDYFLIDPQGLQADPVIISEAALSQQTLAQVYRDQAEAFRVEAQNYAIAAQTIQTTQWMVVGQKTNLSGRSQDIWGWGDNPQAVAAKNKALWQADIAERNQQSASQIAAKLDQQVETLHTLAQVLTANNNALPQLEGSPADAPEVLALLKTQIAEQKQAAENYFQEAALAEQWRKTNQDKADWHNSLIQRWEVVGSKRGRSGKKTDIYDWRYYPEHIAPRDQAQAVANEAETKRKTFEQLAQTAQQQVDSLTVRAETLERSIRDWDVLKQGIDYEIDARRNQLQANQDALKLNSEVQPQRIAELDQKIQSIQAELDRLQSQLLPPQIQAVNETEQHLQQAQDNLALAQTDKSTALDRLQNFLETSGYFLPYQERLAAIARTIDRIQTDQLQTQEIITQLITQLGKTPNATLQAQLEQAKSIQTNLEQEQLWARVQQEQLKLSTPDSPERLQTSSLVQQLIELKADLPNADLPIQQYLDFLKQVDGSETSFLVGFDNLGDRLAKAKAEKTSVAKLLNSLQTEYIKLGLAKTDLDNSQIPSQQQQIREKEQEILTTQVAIAQVKDDLAIPDAQLVDVDGQISIRNAEIAQQKAVRQMYQTQIDNASLSAQQYEKLRQTQQNAANYWNSQINVFNPTTYLAKYPDVAKAVAERWWGNNTSAFYHYLNWGQYEGRTPNPQAVVYRDAAQLAANDAAKQRDLANQQVQAFKTTFSPQIETIQSQIDQLEQEKQLLLQLSELNKQLPSQQQQLTALIEQLAILNQRKALVEQQLADQYREIDLAKQYALQAQAEANRLQSRLDLLNYAEALGAKSQTAQNQWQQATQALTTAVDALLTTRQLGEDDRHNLTNLQNQLTEKQAKLQKAIAKQAELKTGLDDATQALEFTKLQLGNQLLLKQSLADRDAPLKSAEAYFYNLAQQDRSQMWYWNGREWVYNTAKAEAYRQNLQTASLLAEQRNQVWAEQKKNEQRIAELEQQVTTQTAQVNSKTAEVKAANENALKLSGQVDALKAEIEPIKAVLQPLIDQEKAQLQTFQTATTKAQSVGTQLSLTMQEQASALRRLIGFGVLASESDVDFFATDVEPKVNSFITQLQQQIQNFTTQANNLSQLITSWKEQLARTTDPVIQKSLTEAIAQATAQRTKLEVWQADNQQTLPDLQELLTQAIAALTPLRQKQELEVKQKLENSEQRLEALQSQQTTEAALKNALQANTELSYAQLNSQVNQDLRNTTLAITDQLLESDRQTHAGITQQLSNSQAVDNLLSLITTTLANAQGKYDRSQANLRDGINILSKVVPIESQLDTNVTTTAQAIDRIKFDVAQSDTLWAEIASIAIRYGLESAELKQYQAGLTDPVARAAFLASHPDNGTAIALLQAATLQGSDSTQVITALLKATKADVLWNADAVEGSNPNQLLYEKAKAAEIDHRTQGIAAIIQADWYEKQAAVHWARSRKNGPYWYEQRWVRGRKGRGRWETITHVDQDWIIWNTYANQLVPQLRQQGAAELAEAEKWRLEKERLEPLAKQWGDANLAANEAAAPIQETRNLFEVLKTERESIPAETSQLVSLENLLPIIEQQLAQATQEADAANAKVQQQWTDYDSSSAQQEQAIAQILTERGKINHNAIAIQQQLAEDEKWVERQSIALSTELEQTKVIQEKLQYQRQAIDSQIRALVRQGITTDALDSLLTKAAQIDRTLPLITNKATILTAQQTALTQKRTLLTAQNEVIVAEQRLIEAYINDPSGDYSDLLQQLQDTRAILAEAQRLAEQAAASSQALTAPLQDLQTSLLAQNDEHLITARESQTILKALVTATELNANYALEAAKTQHKVNVLEFQILQRLEEATAAGYQEAKYLLEVARTNNIASAAALYYRDYSDLASDRGSTCSAGLARPEDRILADRYYAEMLTYRQQQQEAQAQADAFNRAKTTAQNQLNALQTEQAAASQALNELNNKLAETQAERDAKEQELAVIQARLDGITRIREQTEQTFYQLVTLENLNLGQAQLEQEIAQLRQGEIDQAVSDRLEREVLEVERKRAETQAKIEQLRQLQAEEELRQSLNTARVGLGLATLDSPEDPAQLDLLLAGLLTSLKDLDTQQPDLPADVKAVLAETRGDIYLALQGKSAETIQDSLLSAMTVLIGQVDQYKNEINRIDLEEQLDNQLLQEAQQDLQGSSQQLLKELERSKELGAEGEVINPLYVETLTRIAYAQQAVDISDDLAAQGREMLDQIIKQRIAERKARKKSFWNKILSIVSTVLSLLGTVLTFVPGANLVGLALVAVSGVINVVQSAINGDWMGAIFSAIMTGASFVGGVIGNAVKAGQAMIFGMLKATAEKFLATMRVFQSLASGAFNGVRSILSGDNIMGFLQIIGGLASAATNGISGFVKGGLESLSDIGEFGYKVIDSLSKAPALIYGGIKAIQSGDWVNGIGNIVKGIISLTKTWTNDFNDKHESLGEKIANILENISSVGIGVSKFITGGLNGLLAGLGDILDGLGDDIAKWVENIKSKDECVICNDEDLTLTGDEAFDLLGDEDDSDFLSQDGLPEGYYVDEEWLKWLDENPGYLIATNSTDDNELWKVLDSKDGNSAFEEVDISKDENQKLPPYSVHNGKVYYDDGEKTFLTQFSPNLNQDGNGSYFDEQSKINYKVEDQQIVGGNVVVNGKSINFSSSKPIDPRKPTVVITHGYIVGGESKRETATLYSEKYPDSNVILIDWGSLSKDGALPVVSSGFLTKEYAKAADSSVEVGKKIGQIVTSLGIDPKNTTLVGHSLGARASQYAAYYIQQHSQDGSMIQNLVLLDPAGPGFQQKRFWDLFTGGFKLRPLPSEKVANLTTVIHTSTRWGDENRIGDIDIYVQSKTIPSFSISKHSYANTYWDFIVKNGLDKTLLNPTPQPALDLPNASVFYRVSP